VKYNSFQSLLPALIVSQLSSSKWKDQITHSFT